MCIIVGFHSEVMKCTLFSIALQSLWNIFLFQYHDCKLQRHVLNLWTIYSFENFLSYEVHIVVNSPFQFAKCLLFLIPPPESMKCTLMLIPLQMKGNIF